MIRKIYQRIKKIGLLLTTALLSLNLTGCRTVQEKILDNLEEAYGTEFEMASFRRVGAVYEPVCYPVEDPILCFEGVYDENGNILADGFVGAIISKEDTDFFTSVIGSNLGESYIYGINALRIDKDNYEYWPTIRILNEKSYSIKDLYDIQLKQNSEYYATVTFLIFVNISSESYEADYKKEYEILENATRELMMFYKNSYGLDVSVGLKIFFLDDVYYKQTVDYYSNYYIRCKTYENPLDEIRDFISFTPTVIDSSIAKREIMTIDEYVMERGNF
jgi:hypothetical protein